MTITFQKRQKEMKRQEKQREKAARREKEACKACGKRSRRRKRKRELGRSRGRGRRFRAASLKWHSWTPYDVTNFSNWPSPLRAQKPRRTCSLPGCST